MRSALDRLAWALVERKVVEGGEAPRETAFPICCSYDAYLKTSEKSGKLTSRSGLRLLRRFALLLTHEHRDEFSSWRE